jgi:hypothetical protein
MEKFLIETGVAANPKLVNIQGRKSEDWAIEGVIRSNTRRPRANVVKFRQMMKL